MRRKTMARMAGMMLLTSLGACAQNCAPDQVATGVARLTMRNLAAVLSAAERDSSCGFSSEAVMANSSSEGEVGELGSVTWTATECRIDFVADTPLATDCLGQNSRASGSIVFSARKTLSGQRTGLIETPIIPAGPDALRYEFSNISFENFWLQRDGDDDSLEMIDGSLRAILSPRLAVDSVSGACSQATPNIHFEDVIYAGSTVILHSADLNEKVPVASSKMQAQSGLGSSEQNALSGDIVVWSESRPVPAAKESKGLDPDFDPEQFEQSYTCNENLAQPLNFVCADMNPQLVDASARLTVPLLTALAAAVQQDSSCGFASQAVRDAVVVSGDPGGSGEASWQVSDCALNFSQPTVVITNCQGAQTLLQGQVQVSGTKTLSGILTGKQTDPVVPSGDDALQIQLQVEFSGLTLSKSDSSNTLSARSGALSADIQPELVLSASGSCDFPSANVRLTSVQYDQASLLLSVARGQFVLDVNTSDIHALSGVWGDEQNLLTGSMLIGEQSYEANSDGLGLDPDFAVDAYAGSWQCDNRLRDNTDGDCSPRRMLAQKSARSGLAMLRAVADQLRANTDCGFAADSVVQQVVLSEQNPGAKGYAMFQVNNCVLDFASPSPVHQDCNGQLEYLQGRATVSASLRVDGWLTADPHEPVLPDSDLASLMDLDIQGEGLRWSHSLDDRALQIDSGELQGQVKTQMALSQRRVCEVRTPMAQLRDMSFTNAGLRLEDDGKILDLVASDASVNAVCASLGREENSMSGWVKIDGDMIQIPFDQAGLDPDYDSAQTAASWTCDADLFQPLDLEHCSYARPLAEKAGRLLVQALATATQVLEEDTACGFQANAVLTSAVSSSNAVTWSTLSAPCAIDFAQDSVVATDCSGSTRHVNGGLTASSEKIISGELSAGPERVWPTTRDAKQYHHASLQLRDWTSYTLADGETIPRAKITVNGSLSASLHALGGESLSHNTGSGAAVYDVTTPLFVLDALNMSSGSVHILVDGKQFDLSLSQVLLQAQKGRYLGQGNSLSGSLRVEGELVTLPDGLKLDPDYEQQRFDASYACTADLVEPIPAN